MKEQLCEKLFKIIKSLKNHLDFKEIIQNFQTCFNKSANKTNLMDFEDFFINDSGAADNLLISKIPKKTSI
jgi:hypothetical protein